MDAENPLPTELHESVEALKQALTDMQAGDSGKPFDEFDRKFRKEHELPVRRTEDS